MPFADIDEAEQWKAIGSRIKALREAREWNQPALARRIGVSTHTVIRWEQGRHRIKSLNARKLAAVLGVTLAMLFGEEPLLMDTIQAQPAVPSKPTKASLWAAHMHFHLTRMRLFLDMQRRVIDEMVNDLETLQGFLSIEGEITSDQAGDIVEQMHNAASRAAELYETARKGRAS